MLWDGWFKGPYEKNRKTQGKTANTSADAPVVTERILQIRVHPWFYFFLKIPLQNEDGSYSGVWLLVLKYKENHKEKIWRQIICHLQASSSVFKRLQASSSVFKRLQASSSVFKRLQASSSVFKRRIALDFVIHSSGISPCFAEGTGSIRFCGGAAA